MRTQYLGPAQCCSGVVFLFSRSSWKLFQTHPASNSYLFLWDTWSLSTAKWFLMLHPEVEKALLPLGTAGALGAFAVGRALPFKKPIIFLACMGKGRSNLSLFPHYTRHNIIGLYCILFSCFFSDCSLSLFACSLYGTYYWIVRGFVI